MAIISALIPAPFKELTENDRAFFLEGTQATISIAKDDHWLVTTPDPVDIFRVGVKCGMMFITLSKLLPD